MVNVSIVTLIKGHRVVDRLLSQLMLIEGLSNAEILVIDAKPGSADDIRKKYPSVRWIYYRTQKKYTIPEQRNLALKKSKGDIIAFIDADCIPKKKWLINLIKPIVESREDFTTGKIQSLRKYPLRWSLKTNNSKKNKYVGFAPNIVGDYDTSFDFGGEDTDYSWRIRMNNMKIRYLDNAVITHDWGDFSRNMFRCYIYGKAYYLLLKKYKLKVPDKINALIGISYALFLLFVPVAIFYPAYLILLILPISKNLLEGSSIAYALENILFNFTNALGFILGMFQDVINYPKR
jgi:cellulose synthase/poly-beta-1,6-N-acetylglucosamine synthase-like glycosyltransferase